MLKVLKIITEILLWIAMPAIRLAGLANRNIRTGLSDRLGKIEPSKSNKATCTVFCCASVGEVATAAPFIWTWIERHPEDRVVIATSTPTGKVRAGRGFEGEVEVYLRPLDFGHCPARWLDAVGATRILLMETELWPFFLWECLGREIPVHVINGRISNRSIPNYRRFRKIFAPVLQSFLSIAVQNETYRARFVELGADPKRVTVTGNLKFSSSRKLPEISEDLKEIVGSFSAHSRVIVAGSTHEGEEREILAAYRFVCEEFPDVKLLLAPRHLERTAEVVAEVKASGFPFVLRSRAVADAAVHAAILILDTHGELAAAYRFGAIAFVGGSLVPVGGHNVLEPAAFAIPVLYGPHIDNFIDEVGLLERSGGGAVVADFRSIAVVLHDLLLSPELLKTKGLAAKQALDQVEGILEMTYQSVENAIQG